MDNQDQPTEQQIKEAADRFLQLLVNCYFENREQDGEEPEQ